MGRISVSLPVHLPTLSIYRHYSPTISAFGTAAAPEPFLDPKVVTERIIEVIKNFEKVEELKVNPESKFKEDLDLDSLDAVEVVMAIEEEFCIEIPDAEADKILSIPDAVAYIAGHPMAK
eukprot:CAMPEP_0117557710 /NCGR_PEP_ID=MMETSP0784-20121206/52464_1 /TAXON_ID=39447 /ORGANISM="" /LENGTH=119 /DNA_ID=CAMNT_0005355023 /DNA_START=61 /DNA_END=420 /DNA_ORIENTATION=-